MKSIRFEGTRCSLVFALLLAVNAASAEQSSNYQLIEQEIQRAEASLETTKKFIEQLLWRDLPETNAAIEQSSDQLAALNSELETLSQRVSQAQQDLAQSKNQLHRSQRILADRQSTLLDTKNTVQQLEYQRLNVLTELESGGTELERSQQQQAELAAQISQVDDELNHWRERQQEMNQLIQARQQRANELVTTEQQYKRSWPPSANNCETRRQHRIN